MSKRKRLESIEKAVAERVAELKSELDTDPGEQQRKKRALQAAEERAQRVERARQKLAELEQEKAARAKTHANEEAKKGGPKVSVSDPEARLMRLADGAATPAWNVQVATAEGFVVAIDPTDRRKDSGLAPGLVAKVAERCGRAPQRLLADTTAMTREDIVTLVQQHHDMTVYSRRHRSVRMSRPRRCARGARNVAASRRLSCVASANGERGRPRGLPPTQADRTGAWHYQKPRNDPLSRAWSGKSTGGLPTAGTGAQPVLGRYTAPPHCCGGGNGDTGDRMTAAGHSSGAFLTSGALLNGIHGVTA
jgi:hypothetical protein